MPKLPVATGPQVIRALERIGFRRISQSGSHVKMRSGERTVIVPDHGRTPIAAGTLRGIIRDAGLTVAGFIDLL